MSLSPGEPASETGDESLSAATLDSDPETVSKPKRKTGHRLLPVSPKSPYYSKPKSTVASWRSLRSAETMPLSTRVSLTPQKLWLGSSKQGRVPGTPVYREKEDMYDEIIELKKSLHMQKGDVDLMRTKLRRLEEENSRKDRQIEQLLDAARGPDFVRTLAEKRSDTGWVVAGLKQRVLRLEQQCKDKDSTISKLQSDMKTTNLEEMRIAMETYYEEIHRLQTLLAASEPAGKKLPVDKKLGGRRQKKMSSALLNLSRSVQELTEENQTLKEDLDRLLSNSPSASKIQGYVEWSKPRLLRRITELETRLSMLESPRPQASELAKPRVEPHHSSVSSPTEPRQPRCDAHERPEPPPANSKSLKDERAAPQPQQLEKDIPSCVGRAQAWLCACSVERKQPPQTRASVARVPQYGQQSEETGETEAAPREQVHMLTGKLGEQEEADAGAEDKPGEAVHKAFEDPQPPVPTSSHSWPDLEPDTGPVHSRPPSALSEGRRGDSRREAAARLLQACWRVHSRKKREAALDEAATVLQAALRGHLVRSQLLAQMARGSSDPRSPSPPQKHPQTPRSENPAGLELEKAVVLVQSVFRAHLARTRAGAPVAATASTSRTWTPSAIKDTYSLAPQGNATAPPPEWGLGCVRDTAQDDSEASSGESEEESAAEEEVLTPGEPDVDVGPMLCRSPPAGALPLVDKVYSEDSDDDIISPSLPGKKSCSS
ncbi:IQ domain-containing protein E isoform X2 [Tenrec ecaudatus]|uniref:IQ domain-containing protein E isoform X2 n=1 Tax=Tenrec ecaudatus TaxID=94439 RepID=UPI003F59E0DA